MRSGSGRTPMSSRCITTFKQIAKRIMLGGLIARPFLLEARMFRLSALVIAFTATATAQNAVTPQAAKIAAIEDLLSVLKLERTQQQYLAQIQPLLAQQINGMLTQVGNADARAKMGPDIQEFQKQMGDFIA